MRVKPSALAQIFKSAQDCWPEDEAGLLVDGLAGCAECGYTSEELETLKTKNIAHMEQVFNSESDAAELKARFHAEIERLMRVDNWISSFRNR